MRPAVKRAGAVKPGCAGFTLLELLISIVIVGMLGGLLMNRAQYYQEQAEKAVMEQTLGTLRSALHLQLASLVVKNRVADIPLLAERNPMEWLVEKPKNYLGEYFDPRPEDVVSGHWYFDLRKRYLIYSVHNAAHFRAASSNSNQIQFQVKLVKRLDVSSEKVRGVESSEIDGVVLEPVGPYTWF